MLKSIRYLVAFAAAFTAVATLATAQDVPTANAGVAAELIGELPLSAEFPDVANRQFRMRVITVEPGGAIGLHSHKNRPSVEYVLSGSAKEYRGTAETAMMAGSKVLLDHSVEHYWRNDGTEPLVILAVDIYQPAP
jgi:mannose-6-phosphate isomerase-like protein (cupin superfamily)